MDLEQARKELIALQEKMSAYNHAMGLLSYDGETTAPAGTAANRGHSMGILSEIMYKLSTGKETVDLLEFLDANPDCDCVAAYQQTRHEGGVMTACKKVFYRLINSVSDIRFYPNASDFRTMRRPMADAVARLTEHHRFAKGIFSWVGFNTHYMPYVADARNAGTTSWSFIKLLKYALEGIMSYTTFPLKLPLYLCAMLCAAAVICLVVALAASSATWGWACFALALSAVQMLALSMIGLYLAHVYMEEKKRPICIERDYITYEEALD